METIIEMECIRCDKTIKIHAFDGLPCNPSRAVYCETDGNYGSQVLDCGGFSIVFMLCDDCIVRNKHNARKIIGMSRRVERINNYVTFTLDDEHIPNPNNLPPEISIDSNVLDMLDGIVNISDPPPELSNW